MEAELRIEDNEFIGVSVTGSVNIPDTVTRIGNHALKDQQITGITIPDSVKSIGEAAFARCYALTSIVIPASVEYVGDDAFLGCTSLVRIKVPKHFDAEAVALWSLPDTCEIIRY